MEARSSMCYSIFKYRNISGSKIPRHVRSWKNAWKKDCLNWFRIGSQLLLTLVTISSSIQSSLQVPVASTACLMHLHCTLSSDEHLSVHLEPTSNIRHCVSAPLKAAQALPLHRGPKGVWRNIKTVVRVKCLPMVTPPAPKAKGFVRQAGVVLAVKWKVFR